MNKAWQEQRCRYAALQVCSVAALQFMHCFSIAGSVMAAKAGLCAWAYAEITYYTTAGFVCRCNQQRYSCSAHVKTAKAFAGLAAALTLESSSCNCISYNQPCVQV